MLSKKQLLPVDQELLMVDPVILTNGNNVTVWHDITLKVYITPTARKPVT